MDKFIFYLYWFPTFTWFPKRKISIYRAFRKSLVSFFENKTFNTDSIAKSYTSIPLPSDGFKRSLNLDKIDQTLTEEEKKKRLNNNLNKIKKTLTKKLNLLKFTQEELNKITQNFNKLIEHLKTKIEKNVFYYKDLEIKTVRFLEDISSMSTKSDVENLKKALAIFPPPTDTPLACIPGIISKLTDAYRCLKSGNTERSALDDLLQTLLLVACDDPSQQSKLMKEVSPGNQSHIPDYLKSLLGVDTQKLEIYFATPQGFIHTKTKFNFLSFAHHEFNTYFQTRLIEVFRKALICKGIEEKSQKEVVGKTAGQQGFNPVYSQLQNELNEDPFFLAIVGPILETDEESTETVKSFDSKEAFFQYFTEKGETKQTNHPVIDYDENQLETAIKELTIPQIALFNVKSIDMSEQASKILLHLAWYKYKNELKVLNKLNNINKKNIIEQKIREILVQLKEVAPVKHLHSSETPYIDKIQKILVDADLLTEISTTDQLSFDDVIQNPSLLVERFKAAISTGKPDPEAERLLKSLSTGILDTSVDIDHYPFTLFTVIKGLKKIDPSRISEGSYLKTFLASYEEKKSNFTSVIKSIHDHFVTGSPLDVASLETEQLNSILKYTDFDTFYTKLKGTNSEQANTIIQKIKTTPKLIKLIIEKGDESVFSDLIESLDKTTINSPLDENCNTPLLVALKSGQVEFAKRLINKEGIGIDITISNKVGSTALHLAAQNGHTNIVELLLSKLTGEDVARFIQTQDNE